ncbi:phosphatidylcholine/phosphatidylserine synthase [Novosphingobium sp. FSW06-99]|uniref:CDP-alcohol phosphatidyltransferase family protein n=1 Tax=Novosphingobium sp. FSW06-99 TaxID=1739113 RepID=UPI00076BD7AF|nr:phosphatidylcholine/phosphatidylserine synthase [Novosphingobium sp. FSW06-99]KUR80160.1 CDP-diacylglycerol O-phosphatidyltransferase [Novosphingobium sp. FSW06-99]
MIDDADAFDDDEASGYDFGRRPLPRGLTLRALVPNAITSAALCCGLTGIRFAIGGDFRSAVLAVILAGMLDGIDGRVARAMRAQSRFGAELDSLSDAIAFGVAPALILYLWSLQQVPRFGWFAALALAVCCALRLARFNAQIDMADQPHKSAGFLTGVPAPVGAGLALMPLYLWIASGRDEFRHPVAVAIWTAVIAFLMISNTATLGWTGLRPRRTIRLEVIGLVGLVFAALLTEPWLTLVGVCAAYIAMLPVGVLRYRRFRQQRAAARDRQMSGAEAD